MGAEDTVSSFTGDRDYALAAVSSRNATEGLPAFEPQSGTRKGAQYSEPTLWELIGLPGRVACGFLAVAGSIGAILWARAFLERERLRRDIWGELAASRGARGHS